MDLGLGNTLLAGDPRLVDHIVGEVKSQGIFDQFRKECIADVDTKPAYQNLRTRVESSVNSFLSKQVWRADLNKNQLRETLRKHIHEAPYLDAGVERIVDQVVNPKVYSVFMPQIEDVVYKFLGIERPKNHQKNGSCGFKDLLPKDLDPVSPESDKNSLKDVSLDSVDADMKETNEKQEPESNEAEKDFVRNGNSSEQEKPSEESSKPLGTLIAGMNLNNSGKSEDKTEEEEEDSPMFEPIDIMNLNESNISNDSHLSGISELTSHRSHSPDFSNETSRDNMDFSNQDSQFSKVSSDSRLSIVTDFGSSNHASTPMSDGAKDDKDGKYAKDNFKAVREFETKSREGKGNYEVGREEMKNPKRCSSSKETSRDGTDSSRDNQEMKERSRDLDSNKSRGSKDSKRDKDSRRKSTSDSKSDKAKPKERSDSSRDSERSKEAMSNKLKDEKLKEGEKKETSAGKEVKDLKDLYKEKIRELREKKELTEKEKLSKDAKASKETKERRDSSRESKRDGRDSKEHRSGSSKSHNSSRSESKSSRSRESSKSDPRGKKDERRYSKDYKSKNNGQGVPDGEKSDAKKIPRCEKDEKTELKQKSVSKSSRSESGKPGDARRDSKGEIDARDKKRRDDKKSKSKDDHSSLRKNPDDRRSTDRDGSNGSNSRTSHKTNSMTNSGTTRTVSNLQKDTNSVSTSSSETSDSIAEKQNEKSVFSIETKTSRAPEQLVDDETQVRKLDVGQTEISLPIKKRPLTNETSSEIIMKKPKFAKNFQEAKRLMKIRRRMEKEKLRKQGDLDNGSQPTTTGSASSSSLEAAQKKVEEDFRSVPDEERVQIIEVRDEEYDEPYPEIQSDFSLEERSQIILGGESIFTSDIIAKNLYANKSTLSDMEFSIRQSLKEMISDGIVDDQAKPQKSSESESKAGTIENEEKNASSTISEVKNSEILASISEIIGNPILEVVEKPASPVKSETIETNELENRAENQIARDNVEALVCDDTKSFEHEESMDVPDDSPKLEIVEDNDEVEENVNSTTGIDEKIQEASYPSDTLGDSVKPLDFEKSTEEAESIVLAKPEIDEELENGITGQDKTLEESESSFTENHDEIAQSEVKIEEFSPLLPVSTSEVKMEDDSNEEREEKVTLTGEISDESSRKESPRAMRMESPVASMSREEKPDEPQESTFDEPEVQEPKTSTRNENLTSLSDDEGPCLYFVQDNEKLERFARFMKSVENEDSNGEENPAEISSEDIACSVSKEMAPPKPKRKYSTSPLTDILLNNSNNNNDAHKVLETSDEADEVANSLKKRRMGRPKKPKVNANLCAQPNLTNGENFVMPLSPESDVSATSEKTPTNPLKDEKSRPRGSNQRYTSDDLYKPRPLFSSSSRRSRRSNQA